MISSEFRVRMSFEYYFTQPDNFMKILRFEDLIAWRKAQDLTVLVYCEFRELKDYGFKDQVCRAAISISNNIAEGFDRNTSKEFVRFLFISKGSCSEVKSMMYLAHRLGYTNKDSFEKMTGLCDEISKMIRGLIQSIIIRN